MTSKIRILLLILTAMCFTLPSRAVLSEDNIDRTLISLSADMEVLQKNVLADLRRFENRQAEFRNDISLLTEICDEAGIVLYSQDERYLYGTLQATQSVKEIIGQIHARDRKLVQLETDLSAVSSRYNELSHYLSDIKKRHLTNDGRVALESSIKIADSLHRSLQHCISALNKDKAAYQALVSKAEQLETYNSQVLSRVKTYIFQNGGESLPELIKHFPERWHEFTADMRWRFFTGQSDLDNWHSKEDKLYEKLDIVKYLSFFLALCFFVATRYKRYYPQWIYGKRIYWTLVLWLTLNLLGFVFITVFSESTTQIRMILLLESEIYLLALLLVASITIRLKRKFILRALISYLPMFVVTYMLIEYREDLVPLTAITLTVPILFLLAFVCQTVVIFVNSKKIERTDRHMAWANLLTLAFTCIVACAGYTVLATMLFLLWIGIVNGLLLMALVKTWIKKKEPAKNSVADLTIRLFVYPFSVPAIIFAALVWVTHVYNLTPWFYELINVPFVNIPDKIGVISAGKLLLIFGLGICVNYGVSLAKNLLRRNPNNRQGLTAVLISIGNIIIWLLYVIAALIILEINKTGLIAAVGGASVGIGFALKDTFENFFSGMSLMTGRLRPGDILEYEGERGKVLDIGVISTRMETEDGPIMTITNRQLFEKNFKNMTRNHRVELRHITFDISAENNPKFVRDLILGSFHGIDGVDDTRQHVVIMRNFGSGLMRVELKVWIDSEKYLATEPAVREAVFEAFNDNGIKEASLIGHIDSKGAESIMTDNNPILKS